MSADSSATTFVNRCLERIKRGDVHARNELLGHTADRLLAITRKVKRDFPQLQRWEQTDDVFQNASIRLCRALKSVSVNDARHYYRLAATQIRRELVDLVRHWQGPQGPGQHHHTQGGRAGPDGDTATPLHLDQSDDTHDPRRIAQWCEFHEQVERLADPEREVFDLLFYHNLSQEEAAEILGIDVRTIKRRWRVARIALSDALQGGSPLDEA